MHQARSEIELRAAKRNILASKEAVELAKHLSVILDQVEYLTFENENLRRKNKELDEVKKENSRLEKELKLAGRHIENINKRLQELDGVNTKLKNLERKVELIDQRTTRM